MTRAQRLLLLRLAAALAILVLRGVAHANPPPLVSTHWPVKLIIQYDQLDMNICGSGCSAASEAMIIDFHYPDTQAKPVATYMSSGVQGYTFEGGPADCYLNVSWAPLSQHCNAKNTVQGFADVSAHCQSFYGKGGFTSWYSGNASIDATGQYLNRVFGFVVRPLQKRSGETLPEFVARVYRALESAPILVRAWGAGNEKENWGHYVVLVGNELSSKKPDDVTASTVLINDPFEYGGTGTGMGYPLSYQEFFVATKKYGAPWFREALEVIPQSTPAERAHTVVVETGNGPNGDTSTSKLELDDVAATDQADNPIWRFNYDQKGTWFFPTEDRIARFTPDLAVSGCWDVIPKSPATPSRARPIGTSTTRAGR